MAPSLRVLIHSLFWTLVVVYLITWGKLSNEYPAGFDDGAFYSLAHSHNAGLDFYDGLVDTKPPLLIYVTALGFRITPSISLIKWLSICMFGALLVTICLVVRTICSRTDIACFAVTIFVTNWSLRHYGFVEISQSYWQAVLSLISLLIVFGALNSRRLFSGAHVSQTLVYALLFLGGVTWAVAFYIKQQALVILPAVAVIVLCYPWPERGLKQRFSCLGIYAVSAAASVGILYFFVLGNSPVNESYKYIFLSNTAGNKLPIGDLGWWLNKSTPLLEIVTGSLRIPIGAFIAFETVTFAILLTSLLNTETRLTLGTERAVTNRGQRGIGALVIGLSVWALATLIFYFLHGRAQTHYLLELPIILVMLVPLIASRRSRYVPTTVMSINVLFIGAILVWHGIVTDPVGPTLRSKWTSDRNVAELISKSTDKADRILLFTNPVLYHLSDRLPASRFPFFVGAWTSPLLLSEFEQAMVRGLTANSTKAVIVHDRILSQLPDSVKSLLIEGLKSNYHALDYETNDVFFGKAVIYVRKTDTHKASTSIGDLNLSHRDSSVSSVVVQLLTVIETPRGHLGKVA
jgi:hypothetical protein